MYFDLLINKDFIIIIKGVFGAYKYGGRYRQIKTLLLLLKVCSELINMVADIDIRRIIDGKTKFLAISLARRPRAK